MSKKMRLIVLSLTILCFGFLAWRAWQREQAAKNLIHEGVPTIFSMGDLVPIMRKSTWLRQLRRLVSPMPLF